MPCPIETLTPWCLIMQIWFDSFFYAPVKVNIKSSHYSTAIYTWSAYGPTFGVGHDLHISGNAGNNSYPYTSCGWSYPLPPGYSSYHFSCQFYAGSYNFTPTDVEVFYEITTQCVYANLFVDLANFQGPCLARLEMKVIVLKLFTIQYKMPQTLLQ